MIKYDKMLKMLADKGYSTYRIRKDSIMGQATYTKLHQGTAGGKNGIDSTLIDRLCALLDCQPGDLMEYVPDGE